MRVYHNDKGVGWIFEAVNGREQTAQNFKKQEEKGEFFNKCWILKRLNDSEEANNMVSEINIYGLSKCDCTNRKPVQYFV